jgi:hypothetical protein
MMTSRIEETLAYFRPLGFFAPQAALALPELARELADRPDAWQGPLREWELYEGDPVAFCDLSVLAHDPDRVWRLESWEYLFAAYARKCGYAHCRNYAEVVSNLARISAHRFELSCEREKAGTMTVKVDGQPKRIAFRRDGKVFSVDFLTKLNEAIGATGHEFAFVSSQRCTGYVVLLASELRERLSRERGWEYFSLEP